MDRRVRHWMSGTVFLSFMLHQVISTFGAMLLGVIATLIPATLIALLDHAVNSSVVDRIVGQTFFKLGADNPYFVAPILMAFILGWISHRFSESRSAALVWVLPALALAWNVMNWKSYSSLPHWADVSANFFSSNCGDSDCLYELFVTAPFYTSVAYSLGWVANLATARAKAGPIPSSQ